MSRRDTHKSKHTDDQAAPQQTGVVDAGEQAESATETGAEQPVDETEALRREVEEWKDKYLRARAEMQNATRRAANERDDAVRFANADLLRSVLDVADDFERAMESAAQSDSVAGVIDGLKLVQDKLAKFLRDHHVETIDAQGAHFDPMQHEALLQQPTAEYAPGTVIQQVQRGYRLRDRVLRPAKVIVAAAPSSAEDTPEANEPAGE